MPGATEFARIPLRPSSLAMALHSTSIPALGTADSASPGEVVRGKGNHADETAAALLAKYGQYSFDQPSEAF